MALSESIISRLQYQHKTIDELISGLIEEQLKHRINPDKWSAFENIVHLAAYQPTFIKRLNLMLNENEPLFERYIAENDPVFYEYLKKSLSELLSDVATKRFAVINLLKNLDEQQLNRKGKHPVFGLIPIASWADFFLLHEAHHLWTIFQLTSMLRIKAQK